MTHDKAVARVKAEHRDVVSNVRDLVDELHEPNKFELCVRDEAPNVDFVGTKGSKILTIEIHEYVSEIPRFVHKLREEIEGASISSIENYRGESDIPSTA